MGYLRVIFFLWKIHSFFIGHETWYFLALPEIKVKNSTGMWVNYFRYKNSTSFESMFGFSHGSHFPACRSPAVATASCGVTFHLSPVQSSCSCLHRGSQQTSTLVQCCWCAAPPSLSDSSKFVIVCGSSWALPDRWQGGRTCCDIPLLCCKSSSLTSETDSHFQVSWCWAQLELLLLPDFNLNCAS